jgi:hypothetical protein
MGTGKRKNFCGEFLAMDETRNCKNQIKRLTSKYKMNGTGTSNSEKVGLFQIVILILSIIVLGSLGAGATFKLPKQVSNIPQTFDTLVVLTNGILWRVYKVIFSKPVDHELVIKINFLALNHHNTADLEILYLYTKESWSKSALSDFYNKKQALSRFSIGAVLLSEPVLAIIKRELKRISSDVKIDTEQIRSVLEQEVLKREVVQCDKADEARKRITRAANKTLRKKAEKS